MTNAVKVATRASLEALEAYVPLLVRERLARDPSPLTKPVIEHFPAAVLFADLSGFTPLAEELAKQGAVGAERLKEVLDICFGKLVDLANAFGGDVIKFPGDGALILWRARHDGTDEDLARAVRLASKCGLQIQENLDELEAIQLESREAIRLRLRVAIGAGRVFAASVGGSEDRWEFVVGGPALQQIEAAARLASPGEVACSPEAWTLLETRTAKAAGQGVRILREIEPAPPPIVEVPKLPMEAGPALRQYIPRVIQTRIDAGQAGWLAEFRSVTVWFANVPAADLAPGGAVDFLQTIAATMQKAAHRFGGGVNELVVDDKGLTMVAGWGQSLAAHDDDASRACQAAMQAQRELREKGVECGMGIASGTAFLATRGGPSRAEYAIIGDVVNLAARLMGAALTSAGHATVLCDAATRSRSRRRMVFESLPPVHLKGKAEPVAIFRPLSRKERQVPGRQPFFGRQAEQDQLAARLDALAQRGDGGVVVIMGDAGIGKSRMIADLLERTQASTVRSLVGLAEEIERSSPYYAWRNILTTAARPEHLDPRLAEFMRSWSGVIPQDLHDSETEGLTAEARAQRTRDMLVEVVSKAIGGTPTLIVLEDAHWFDSASWALAEALRNAVPELLLVISSRPLSSEQMPAELHNLLKRPDAVRLDLRTLTPEESVALVSYRLDVDSLPEAVTHLIQQKAEGHPFFIEQFAFALRDQGVIRVVDGECVLVGDVATLSSSLVPETIQATIRGRIDRLTPKQQLTLKVASVLGRAFRIEELEHIHPLHPDAARLAKELDLATELELMRPPESEGAYSFQHAITQEVAYSMLSFAQRRQLHRAVAEWLESRPSAELADIYPLLAHHWSETEDTLKALDYLEKAGEAAIAAFANREAMGFFRRALAVADARGKELPDKALTLRRAHWHRRIGEALFNAGDPQDSFNESSRCLDELGLPLAHSRSGKLRAMAGHIAAQAVHLTFPSRFVERDAYRRACYAEAAEAASRCAWTLYASRESLTLLLASLAAVTWAQKAEQQSVMSLGVAGITLASFRLKKLADRCFAVARASALESKQFQQLAWVAAMESQNLISNGKLADCEKMLMDSFPPVESSGDRQAISNILSSSSVVSHFFGRYSEMRARNLSALEVLGNGTYRSAPYLHYLAAEAEFALSRPREARAEIEERRRKATELTQPDDGALRFFTSLEAAVYARLKDWAKAKELVEKAIADGVPAISPPAWCPSYLLDACTGLWEHLAAARDRHTSEIARKTQRVLRSFRFHAWVHPVHQPTYLLARGQVAWLKGRHEQAMKSWRKSLEAAERLSRLYEQGLCHYETGRRSPNGSPDRRSHLEKARSIFAQCNTPYLIDQVDALLGGG